jgi:uncharacterized integral membrane protein (TIGR00697 family)
MGFKLIPLFQVGDLHLNASVAIFVLPFIFSINDVMIEVYGIKKALALSRLGFLVIAMIAVLSLFFTTLPSADRFMWADDAYNTVFGFSVRVAIASLVAFAVAQVTDIVVFQKIRQRLGKKSLWIRTNVSNIIGLLIDTVVFMIIARYDFGAGAAENAMYLIGLILPYWIFKCFMSVMITPLTYAGVKWLKRDKTEEDK